MSGRNEAKHRRKGGPRMKQLGYHQVQVWLNKEELAGIRLKFPNERLASLLRRLAVQAAHVQFHIR